VPLAYLDYDFDLWHVGIILKGRGAAAAGRLFAERLGFRSLHGEREEELAWIWLGSRREPSIGDIVRSAYEQIPAPTRVAIGEPRQGLDGWRLSHREAQAAAQVMSRKPARVTRGSDVVLLAAVLNDETLVRSLLDTYLVPIEEIGNRSEVVLDTLRSFLSAGWNAAAASEELGIDRHTIRKRIKRVEKALDQPLHTCSAELQVALEIADLEEEPGQSTPRSRPRSTN
jgi:DNA-binding PucR family transcriptional regulator